MKRITKHIKSGYTLIEAAFSIVYIGIMLSAVIMTLNFTNNALARQKALSSMDSIAICITEIIQTDLDNGVDILSQDYDTDTRISSDKIHRQTTIYFEEEVYGNTLYQVEIKMTDPSTGTIKTAKFLLM